MRHAVVLLLDQILVLGGNEFPYIPDEGLLMTNFGKWRIGSFQAYRCTSQDYLDGCHDSVLLVLEAVQGLGNALPSSVRRP